MEKFTFEGPKSIIISIIFSRAIIEEFASSKLWLILLSNKENFIIYVRQFMYEKLCAGAHCAPLSPTSYNKLTIKKKMFRNFWTFMWTKIIKKSTFFRIFFPSIEKLTIEK